MFNIFFCKDGLKKLRPDVYGLDDVTEDLKLYKYIDLSALVDIIDGNYLVRLRKFFSDRHEQGELSNPFIEHMLPVGYKVTGDDIKRWDDLKQKRLLSGDIPTSCFTLESEEMYHFWKSYTQNYTGIRISTTLGKLLDALEFSGFELYVGKMRYSKMDIPAYDMTKYLFCKKLWYQPENEFRIYFIPKGLSKIEDGIKIKINVKCISEIVLSPFIPRSLKGKMFTILKSDTALLDCKVNHSAIREKSY